MADDDGRLYDMMVRDVEVLICRTRSLNLTHLFSLPILVRPTFLAAFAMSLAQ